MPRTKPSARLLPRFSALCGTVLLFAFTACGSADDDGGGDPQGILLPDVAYCDDVQFWTPERIDYENRVLELVNIERSQGADCGSEGVFGSADPLVMEAALTCAARVHSKDMADRGYFSHNTPDGQSPWDRMAEATYAGFAQAGENIAQGQSNPEAVIATWMNSDGHCSNIMDPGYTEIGVGYYDGNYWTQVFARPR